MIGFKKAALGLVLLGIVGIWALPATAGLLDTAAPYQGWKGTSTFVAEDEPELNGTVDWIVFDKGQFPFSGYGQPNEYTYVYQVHCGGDADISAFTVGLEGEANNIGSFSDGDHGVTGVAPSSLPYITEGLPGSANWKFGGIIYGDSSCGLVFSSPNPPMEYTALVVNSGEFAYLTTCSPLPVPIPEPGTICLLAIGLGLALAARRFRRR